MSESETVTLPRAQAQAAQAAQDLLNRLLGHPEAGTLPTEALIAKVNPTAKFPVKEAREALLAPFEARLKAGDDARDALAKQLSDDRAERKAQAEQAEEVKLLDRLNTVRTKRGFSEETMEKVLARMREQNNPDIDAAAAWVAETLPKPSPAIGHDFLPSTVDAFGSNSGDKAWESLHQSPDQWQTAELRKIVADPEFLALGNP